MLLLFPRTHALDSASEVLPVIGARVCDLQEANPHLPGNQILRITSYSANVLRPPARGGGGLLRVRDTLRTDEPDRHAPRIDHFNGRRGREAPGAQGANEVVGWLDGQALNLEFGNHHGT